MRGVELGGSKHLEALIGYEIGRLNNHLPKSRTTLGEVLRGGPRYVQARDGSQILFVKEDVERLSAEIPSKFHDRVKLPFLILRRMDLGKSTYSVAGDEFEERVVAKLLGLEAAELDKPPLEVKSPLYLYKPHISELIRRFHSVVILAFGLRKEFD